MLDEDELNRLYTKIQLFDGWRPLEIPNLESFKIKISKSQSDNSITKQLNQSNDFVMSTADMIYTFEAPEKNVKDLDFGKMTEQCKLESIIDQYMESNKRLNDEVSRLAEKNDYLKRVEKKFRIVFEDFRDDVEEEDCDLDLAERCDKVIESLRSKEIEYFGQSLKEFLDLLFKSFRENAKNGNFISGVMERKKEGEKLFKDAHGYLNSILEIFEDFSNVDRDKPVNIYLTRRKINSYLKNFQQYLLNISEFNFENDKAKFINIDQRKPFEEIQDEKLSLRTIKTVKNQKKPEKKFFDIPLTNTKENSEKTANKVPTEIIYTFEESRKLKPQIMMTSHTTQTDFKDDEEILFPIDYRVCIRCGSNETKNPYLCVYKIKCAMNKGNGFRLDMKEYQAKEHIYKVDNERENEKIGEFMCVKNGQNYDPFREMRTLSTQTVLGVDDLRVMKKKTNGKNLNNANIMEKELLTPKGYSALQ